MEQYLAQLIEPFKDDLAKHYCWQFDEKVPSDRFGIVAQGNNWLEKTLSLKCQLSARLKAHRTVRSELINIANYFIQEWGGINRFDRAADVIDAFKEIMDTEVIPSPGYKFSFDGISSWSKWLALACPSWACIYDARVAYTLNVLNFINGGTERIFPSPEGRNSKLKMFDISSLLLSVKVGPGDRADPEFLRNKYFVPRKQAYREYLSLVAAVSERVWKDGKHLHHVEMLLFALADNVVYQRLLDALVANRRMEGVVPRSSDQGSADPSGNIVRD